MRLAIKTLITIALLGSTSWSQCLEQIVPLPIDSVNNSLEVDGDWAFVGFTSSSFPDGGVRIYLHAGLGWIPTQTIQASDGAIGDRFGLEVKSAGDQLAVYSESRRGSIYVFERGAAGAYTEQQKIDGAPTLSRFDRDFDLQGDWLAISALNFNGTRHAATHLFQRGPGSGYTWSQTLSAPRGIFDFGFTPRLSGNQLALRSAWPTPRVFLFEQQAGSWSLSEQVFLQGYSVPSNAFAFADNSMAVESGNAVQVWSRRPSGWEFQEELQPPAEGQGYQEFGSALAIEGGRLLIGASQYLPIAGPNSRIGALYVYSSFGGTWQLGSRITEPNLGERALLGTRVALSGADVVGLAPGTLSGAPEVLFATLTQEIDSFCSCDQGVCENAATGLGCSNSTGQGARLDGCGSTSLVANDLQLQLEGLPPFQPVLFSVGRPAAAAPFADGALCLSRALIGALPSQVSDAAGNLSVGDISAGLVNLVQAGDSLALQAIYADPFSPCGAGLNLTNAIRIRFLP